MENQAKKRNVEKLLTRLVPWAWKQKRIEYKCERARMIKKKRKTKKKQIQSKKVKSEVDQLELLQATTIIAQEKVTRTLMN